MRIEREEDFTFLSLVIIFFLVVLIKVVSIFGNGIMRMFIIIAILALVSVICQDRYQRIDFSLEYTGKVSVTTMMFSLKTVSETITTMIDPTGDINYEISERIIGPVSLMNGTYNWVDVDKTFTSNFYLSFGGSHISQPHVISLTSLDLGFVLPSQPEITHVIAQYNVTSGIGAFQNATGGVTVIGYSMANGDATYLVSGIFWVVPPSKKR